MEDEGTLITIADARELLDKESKKRELTYEQRMALQHASQFARLAAGDARKLMKELLAIPKVNGAAAAKMTEILPTHPDDVRAVFAKERFTLDTREINAILEAVRKHL